MDNINMEYKNGQWFYRLDNMQQKGKVRGKNIHCGGILYDWVSENEMIQHNKRAQYATENPKPVETDENGIAW